MTTLEKIAVLREKNGNISINRLEKECGLSKCSMQKWDKHFPSAKKLQKVADYFNVSIESLLPDADSPRVKEVKDLYPGICQGQMPEKADNVVIQHFRAEAGDAKSARSDEAERTQLIPGIDDGNLLETLESLLGYFKERVQERQENVKPFAPEPAPEKVIPFAGNSFAAGTGDPDLALAWSDYKVPADSPAEFAIRINGDSMEPYLPDGSIAFGKKTTPRDGDVGAFFLDGEFLCKQVCQDITGTLYFFSLNRDRKDADFKIPADVERNLLCFGTIIMDKKIPLPADFGGAD